MARVADPLAKSKLLHAARTEFAVQGLASARVEDIARRAGLAKGSFYLHFRNKEEAFLDIVNAFFAETARIAEQCQGVIEKVETSADVLAAFRKQDEQLLGFLWENRDVLKMILDGTSPTYSNVLDGFLDSRAQIAVHDIRRFQERGLYRKDVDPEAVARIITGGYYNVARQLTQLKAKPDLTKLIDTVHKIFLEGLFPRPASRRANS